MTQTLHYTGATAPVALTAAAFSMMAMVDLSSDIRFEPEGPPKAQAPRALPSAWFERQAAAIKTLPQNWDQYGADPIARAVVDRVVAILKSYLPSNARPGSIVPGADGSVQAEWHLQQLSMGLLAEEDGTISCWVRAHAAADETERFGLEAIDLFATVARTALA